MLWKTSIEILNKELVHVHHIKTSNNNHKVIRLQKKRENKKECWEAWIRATTILLFLSFKVSLTLSMVV